MNKLNIILLLILSFSYVSAFSQIVNVEKKRKANENGFQGKVALEFNLKENGKSIVEFKNQLDIQYKYNANSFILLNDIRLFKVNEGDIENAGFQHLRYNYTIKDSSFLTLEAFGQYQYNAAKLLKERLVAGGGPRFRLVDNKTLTFYVAPLGMYERETLSDSLNTQILRARLDSYANIYVKISKNINFRNIIYYQPSFLDFDDYRVSGEAGLSIKITKYFSFDTSIAYDYDSTPPEDIQNTFYYYKNKIVFKF